LDTLRKANKDIVCSYSIIALPSENKWKMNTNRTNTFLKIKITTPSIIFVA
jgi:hypothetical protein